MPVRRFRSIAEMKREARWRPAGTPELWRAIASIWDLGRRTRGARFPPGVYRHRSIDSLNALTATWGDHRGRRSSQPR